MFKENFFFYFSSAKEMLAQIIAERLYGVKYEAYNKDGGRTDFSSLFQQPALVGGRLG
jgi:hypothetical protein